MLFAHLRRDVLERPRHQADQFGASIATNVAAARRKSCKPMALPNFAKTRLRTML